MFEFLKAQTRDYLFFLCGLSFILLIIVSLQLDRSRRWFSLLPRRLQESDSMQRLLLQHIDAGVAVIDADTYIIELVNERARTFWGARKTR